MNKIMQQKHAQMKATERLCYSGRKISLGFNLLSKINAD
jgi:hypothetical protein